MNGGIRSVLQTPRFRLGRALIGSAFIYALAGSLAGLVPLILLPLLTRLMPPEDYGRIAMLMVFIQFLAPITGLNVHGAVGMRYFQRDAIDFPSYVATCLIILLASTTGVLLVVIVLAPLLSKWTGITPNWLLLAVVACSASFVVQTQLAIWQSAKKAWRFASLRVSQALLDLGLSVLLVLGLGLAWQGRAAGIILALVVCAVAALATLRMGGWLAFPARLDYARNALAFSIPLIPYTIGGMLIAMVDRVMITNMLSVSDTGVYFVAVQVGLAVQLVADSVNRALSPWLIESLGAGSPSRDRLVVRTTYLYFTLLLAGGVLAGTLAPVALQYLVGENYRAAGPLIIYITVGQAIGGMYLVVSNYIFWAGNTGRLAIVSLTSGLANVAMSYWLLKSWGLRGPAMAYLVAQCLLLAGAWWLANRSRPMPWLSAFGSKP